MLPKAECETAVDRLVDQTPAELEADYRQKSQPNVP
jgi:hypothetical protein